MHIVLIFQVPLRPEKDISDPHIVDVHDLVLILTGGEMGELSSRWNLLAQSRYCDHPPDLSGTHRRLARCSGCVCLPHPLATQKQQNQSRSPRDLQFDYHPKKA